MKKSNVKNLIIICFSLSLSLHLFSQAVSPGTSLIPKVEASLESEKKLPDVKSGDAKPDFVITQFIANDVNFRGVSILGEKLDRRNQESYKSVSDAWHVSSNVAFQLPASGFKLFFTANNPIENRGNRDVDNRFQSSPGGDEQISKVNQSLQTGVLTFDPNSIRLRREQNGLRDVFIGQLYYDWETKVGGFRTGLFFLNNQNYPAKFNLGEWVIGYRPGILKFLNPEINTFYRMTSELSGITNANVHTRASVKYEIFKDQFFRIVPVLEAGYQAANNNIDKRNGFSDVTARIQFFFGNFLLGVNGIHRPNLYMYDSDRNYPKTGFYSDTNANDGKTVDPSKVSGLEDRALSDAVSQSNNYDFIKQATIRNYQEQQIVRNIFIINIGYTIKF